MPTRAILFGSKLGRASPKGVEGPPPVAQWVFVILGMLLNITGVVLTIIAFVQAVNSTTDRSIDDNALRDVARDVCLGLERPVNYGGQINDFYNTALSTQEHLEACRRTYKSQAPTMAFCEKVDSFFDPSVILNVCLSAGVYGSQVCQCR